MKTSAKHIKCNLKYCFGSEELVALGKELGESQLKLRQLDDDRKMVVDEWKSRISGMESHINSLSNKCCSGYEYREVECSVTFDDPKPGEKTIRRLDVGLMPEIVSVRPMDDQEKQKDLPLS